MKFLCLFWPCFVLAMLLAPNSKAEISDWLVLNPLQIDFLLRFDASQQKNEDFKAQSYNLRGGFQLSQEGHLLHPGIFKFSYFIEPSYGFGEYTNYRNEKDDSSNDQLSYAFSAEFLRGTILPVEGSLSATKRSTDYSSALGYVTDSDITDFYAILAWKFKPFPIHFIYENRSLNQRSVQGSGGLVTKRIDDTEIFTLEGQSEKMLLSVEHFTLDDKLPETNHDFQINRAKFRHVFTWGRGSHLRSEFDYHDRSGFNAYKRNSIRETVFIRHTESLTSQSEYFGNVLVRNQKGRQNIFSFRLNHQLYQNLTTYGRMSISDIRSDDFIEDAQSIELDANYYKSDIKGASVSLSAGGSFNHIDRDSRSGFYEVVDESHPVPITGEVILNNRFINTSTIIVTNDAGTLVYVKGVDYQLSPAVDYLTRLTVLPGGQILPGDIILVSYNAATLPSIEYNQVNSNMGFSLQFGGLGFAYWYTATDNRMISGEGGNLLRDLKNKHIGVDYRWDTAHSSLRLGADRDYWENGLLKQTSNSFTQSFMFRVSQKTQLDLSLSEYFVRADYEDADSYVIKLRLHWQPNSNWSIRPTLGAWRRSTVRNITTPTGDVGDTIDEDVLTAGLHVSWSYRLLSMTFDYNHNDRTLAGRQNVDDRVFLSLRRNFR